MNFVAKKELFVFPLGYYFNMGGAPLIDLVERTKWIQLPRF
jgi:hypothetical protein